MNITTRRNRWTPHASFVTSVLLVLLSPAVGRAADNATFWKAVQTDDLSTLTALVEANTNLIHTRDSQGKNALHHAAEAGRIETVKFLLEHGSKLKERDNRGWTALHHAVYNDHADVAALLMARGAEVDAPNAMNWTPLHQAVFKKNKTLVVALINAGADVFAKTNRDLTPYNLAVDSGRKDITDRLVACMSSAGSQPQRTLLLATGAK